MLKLITSAFLLLSLFVVANVSFAETDADNKASTTTWVNEQGNDVRGNWTTGEIIEIKTVEEYYWHMEHYDPSAQYQVAPWLYDPFNLARQSGGDEGKD